jgi:hypothetical protein
MNTQLIYNQTYAYRLPPTYINQARALADFHEDGVFSGRHANDIGNSQSRLILLGIYSLRIHSRGPYSLTSHSECRRASRFQRRPVEADGRSDDIPAFYFTIPPDRNGPRIP